MRVPQGTGVCGSCLREPPPFERAVAAVDYAFPWDRLILDFKFHGQTELAAVLSELLVEAVQAAGVHDADLVLPVPLGPGRLVERGFNQAWEVACRVAGRLGRPAHAAALQRPLDTAHQADLPREQRALNLNGAFLVALADRRLVDQRRIALVDDVLTTGATARAAAAALQRAGAASVQVWAVARTA